MRPVYSPAAPRRIHLEHPIEVPGGTLATLLARPLTARDGELRRESDEGEIRAVANAVFASPEVVLELSDLDWINVMAGLRDVAADYFRTGLFKPALRLVPGGKQ